MKYKTSAIILLFNNKGELTLQKRAAHDTSYPLHWDFSAAGGIDEGEDPAMAAIRELREELGVEASPEFISEFLYQDEAAQDRLYVFRANYDGPFAPDPNEVAEVQSFPLSKVKEMLESGEKFHPEFSFLWNQNLSILTR